MNIDLKRVLKNEDKYNSINLLDCSIYENIITIYCELLNHDNKDKFAKEIELIEKFMKLYDKFSKYEFINLHFCSKYSVCDNDNELVKDADLIGLFQAFYCKINLLVDDFMKIVEYNPNRVSINKKTSVFLIAYATELKELWEEFSDEFIEEIESKCIDFSGKIYREEYMKEKLKYTPPLSAKGAWAKGPINLSK
jgi:hypothetical protein